MQFNDKEKHNFASYEEACEALGDLTAPEYYNFAFDVIDAWAERERNRVALVHVDAEDRETKWTFFDVAIRSNQLANVLMGLGIGKGDRVMVMMHRHPEWWVTMAGLMKLGAVAVPSTPMLRAKDIAYRVDTGELRGVIADSDAAVHIDQAEELGVKFAVKVVLGARRPGWVAWEEEVTNAARQLVGFDHEAKTKATDPMVLYFTSGTEGMPKMVVHDYGYAIGHRITAEAWQDLQPEDLHWTLSDTGWAKAAWGLLFGQWIVGAAIFVHDARGKFDPHKTLALLEQHMITTFCAPPTAYRMLILEDLRRYDLSALRHCVSAGEPLNPEVIETWKNGTGLTIREGYGQTESVCMALTMPCMEVKPGAMGKPAPGFDLHLLDDEGNDVPVGEEGSLAVRLVPKRPLGLFREYYKSPEQNAESFRGDYYYTGDRARFDEDGYLWFVGRDDDVFKASGYRISPFEVESALVAHPAVAEAAVIGVPDKVRGTVIKAFVILIPGNEPSTELEHELQEFVKETTAPYKYPRHLEFVTELPKTVSGKIRRAELRKLERDKTGE